MYVIEIRQRNYFSRQKTKWEQKALCQDQMRRKKREKAKEKMKTKCEEKEKLTGPNHKELSQEFKGVFWWEGWSEEGHKKAFVTLFLLPKKENQVVIRLTNPGWPCQT